LSQSDLPQRLAEQLPVTFRDEKEPVFAEPWQAQAFALAVSLIDSGRISWNQWADTLGDEISHAADHGISQDGSGYYELWLRALERLVTEKDMAAPDELSDLREGWRRAYEATPHGEPVRLNKVLTS
jgi:nitrile hydratase accessory protein